MGKKSLGWIILIIFLGALLGSALGEIIAYLIPNGVVQQFFLTSAQAHFGPATLNIVILTLTFGFSFKLNVIGIIGIMIAAYLLKWVN
ncbi:MAG: DUF4321 domain-containing protein [Calditrichaeota bacterium]|nr:DUF4321 domain-containing protein [Calditrichota bacterium]